MPSKRFSIGLALIGFLILPSLGSAGADCITCSVKGSCVAGEVDLLQMSGTSNAHASIDGTYSNHVCCSGPVDLSNSCSGGVVILRLSSTNNAHVEQNTFSNYPQSACLYSSQTPLVSYGASCPIGYACVASISAATNAHIGNCSSYPTKVCVSCVGTPVNGVCGPAAKAYASNETFPQGAYCSAGTSNPATPANPPQGGSSTWTCQGQNGGTNATCTATRTAAIINGVCGLAAKNYTENETFPNGSLCLAGAPPMPAPTLPLTPTSSVTWICWGLDGGTNATCTALRVGCGDGILQTGEECDDGNTLNGDGCTAICYNECVYASNYTTWTSCINGTEYALGPPFGNITWSLMPGVRQSDPLCVGVPSTRPCGECLNITAMMCDLGMCDPTETCENQSGQCTCVQKGECFNKSQMACDLGMCDPTETCENQSGQCTCVSRGECFDNSLMACNPLLCPDPTTEDCIDPGSGLCTCIPRTNESSCTDGADNDGDGKIDCLDPDCCSDLACPYKINEGANGYVCCDNTLDDDGDGSADSLDMDCVEYRGVFNNGTSQLELANFDVRFTDESLGATRINWTFTQGIPFGDCISAEFNATYPNPVEFARGEERSVGTLQMRTFPEELCQVIMTAMAPDDTLVQGLYTLNPKGVAVPQISIPEIPAIIHPTSIYPPKRDDAAALYYSACVVVDSLETECSGTCSDLAKAKLAEAKNHLNAASIFLSSCSDGRPACATSQYYSTRAKELANEGLQL